MFIFLMSSERAGSNFITKLMNGHPDIVGPSPKHLFNPVARNLFRYGDLNKEKNWHELLKDIHRLMNAGFSEWKKQFSLEELKTLGKNKKIDNLLRNIFLEEAKANGAIHVFVKENHLYEFMPFLMHYFPEAKYIFNVRDPRDMALSWKKNPSHKGGVVSGAKQWQKDQQNFLKHFYVLKKMGKGYQIKYEDLVSQTEHYAKEICEFIGVTYSNEIMGFYLDELTVKNSSKQVAWSNLSKGILTDNFNKYKHQLTEEEIKIIEKICYYEMKVLGYQPMFDKKELDELGDEVVAEKLRKDLDEIEHLPSESTLKNIEAKKVFYQKIIED